MNYEAKFSAIGKAKGMAFLAIILCWLIIPLIIWICYCISVSSESVTISADKIVWRKGILNKTERISALTGVLGVSVSQTFGGKIFNYGDVHLNSIGRHSDVNFEGVKDPYALRTFLNKKIVNSNNTQQIITE